MLRIGGGSTWQVRAEGFDPTLERGVEALLAIGNGYACTRGALEEGCAASHADTFLAGVFDPVRTVPEPPSALDETPKLVVAPCWTGLTLWIDGERLTLDEGEALDQVRVLDMRRGLFVRRWRQRQPSGRVTRVVGLRYISLGDRHVFVQRVRIVPENYAGRIRLEASLAGRRADPPLQLLEDAPPGTLAYRTHESGIVLALAQCGHLAERGRGAIERATEERRDGRLIERWEWQAEQGRGYVFDRLVACYTSRDGDAPATVAARRAAELGRNAGGLLRAHRDRWAERRRAAEVRIVGDQEAERALRFSTYHLTIAADPTDEHVAIGARSLTGQAYNGHYFWDGVTYMLPFYIFTWPEAARALLSYRYHTLDAARRKAALFGYRGALYAWESAATGNEVTPDRLKNSRGERIPIYTGRRGHHISADVAHGVGLYWRATGDDGFMLRHGFEILLETARFWASRAGLEADGRYHIGGVVGPDEYHEDVDDNAYTNGMARANLELAREADAWLARHQPRRRQELYARLGLGGDEAGHWQEVAAKLAVDLDPRTGVIEQFAGYFGLREVDLGQYATRTSSMQDVLGRAGAACSQVIKQPDVVLLLHLLWGRFDRETVARNVSYYEPRCDHGSSLSPSVHALLAARLGQPDAARRYFRQAAQIDLHARPTNAARGIHAANCGGLWQAVVFGVAGMEMLDDGLAFDPHLPSGWESLEFAVQWHGRWLRVAIGARDVRLHLLDGPGPMCVRVGSGEARRLSPGDSVSVPLAGGREAVEAAGR